MIKYLLVPASVFFSESDFDFFLEYDCFSKKKNPKFYQMKSESVFAERARLLISRGRLVGESRGCKTGGYNNKRNKKRLTLI